jgi:hypothetical protein
LLEFIPLWMAHHEQMPDRFRPIRHERQRQVATRQPVQITRRRRPPPAIARAVGLRPRSPSASGIGY